MGIEKVTVIPKLIMGTTVGLVKHLNEDRLGCLTHKQELRMAIADGHWGEQAADMLVKHWLKTNLTFPTDVKNAISETRKVETKLFKRFGQAKMNPEADFTPEASFTVIQVTGNKLRSISYGDCRMLIVRSGKVQHKLKTKETWLGAFSRLGLRSRLAVNQALIFEEWILKKNDLVVLFSDGVDQCVYETDTLSNQFLAKQTIRRTLEKSFDQIMAAVFTAGAEDNATLAVLKV